MGGVVGMGVCGRMDVHRPTLQTATTALRFFASRPCLVTPEPRQLTDKSLFSVRAQKGSAARRCVGKQTTSFDSASALLSLQEV